VKNIGNSIDVEIDNYHRVAGTLEVSGYSAAHATPSADDRVAAYFAQLAIHAPPPNEFSELPLDNYLHGEGKGV
jgi:hypothetical protein